MGSMADVRGLAGRYRRYSRRGPHNATFACQFDVRLRCRRVLGATAEPEKAENSQDHDHDQDDQQNAEDAPPCLDTGRDSFFPYMLRRNPTHYANLDI